MRISTCYSNILLARRTGTPTHAEVRDDLARAMAARFVSPLAR